MAKGFGKFMVFCGLVGAAAAGAYYYMNQRDKALADDFDDDFDAFDDFDDFEEEASGTGRSYVNLDGHEKEDGAVTEDTPEAADTEAEAPAAPEKKTHAAAAGENADTEDFFDDTEA